LEEALQKKSNNLQLELLIILTLQQGQV
jgi:hypothetical protein